MSDLIEKDPENEDSNQQEIESPVDGPPPDWMKTATSSSGSAFNEDDAPDWLKNIRAGKSAQTETEMSESETMPESELAAGADDNMSDLERLLAEEGIELSGIADERPEEAEGMSVKDWMIATSDDEIIRKRIGAEEPTEEPVPIPVPEPEPAESAPSPEPVKSPPEPEVPAAEVVEEDLPDWLREISDEVETSPDVTAAPEPIATVDEDQDDKMVVDDDLPDWLREVSEEVQPTTPSVMSESLETVDEEQDDVMVVEEGLPEWLQEVSDAPAPVSEPVVEAPVSEDVSPTEEEMPDWLQEVADEAMQEAVTSTTDDDKLVVADELPSWLREVEEEHEEVPPEYEAVEPEPIASEAAEIVSGEGLPDWLREAEESSVEEEPFAPEFEAAPPSYSLTDSTDTAIDEENLPDWLRDVRDEEGVDLVTKPVVDKEESDQSVQEIDEEELLPDWLKEVQEEEELLTAPETEPVVSVAADTTLAETEDILEEELPDWLQEVQEAEGEPFEPSEPSPDDLFAGVVEEAVVAEGDLPDWLQEEVQEGMTEVPVAEEAVAATPEPEISAIAEEELIDEEELPEWLQIEEEVALEPEVEPVSTPLEPVPVAQPAVSEEEPAELEPEEPEPEVAEIPPSPVTEEVAPAVEAVPVARTRLSTEMPDWLKKLREGDVEEVKEAAPVEPLPKPVSVEPMAKVAYEPAPAAEPEAQFEAVLPEDADERLELARAARDAGDIVEAAQYYESLVSSSLHLDRVIEDIQQTVKSYPSNALLYQIMGDAMMKDGRLQSALDAYRQALAKL